MGITEKPSRHEEWLISLSTEATPFFPFPDRSHVGTWAQETYRMQDATDTVRGLVVELSSLK